MIAANLKPYMRGLNTHQNVGIIDRMEDVISIGEKSISSLAWEDMTGQHKTVSDAPGRAR